MDSLDRSLLQTPDLNKERLAKFKELYPDLFTPEGELIFDEVKKIVDPDSGKETERFEFKWYGKSEAKRTAFTPSRAALVYDETRSVNPDAANGNMIIEGENLEVLKCLLAAYREKIKCIYIDPPYNTGNDFVYSDKWDETKEDYWKHIGVTQDGIKMDTNTDSSGRYHSNWLNLMYSRLLIARQLLMDDGVIFISMDDNEVHHLRKLCEEVFGEGNLVNEVVWQRAYAPINLKKYFSEMHEYILVYAKNKPQFILNPLPRTEEQDRDYKIPDNDPRGPWKVGNLSVGPIIEKQVYEIITPSGRKVMPPKGYCWRYTKERFEELLKDNRIWFGAKGDNVPTPKIYLSEVKDGVTPSTWWGHKDVGHNQDSMRETRELFGNEAIFTNPKPVKLLKRIINLGMNNNDLILDFFAGSGTTAHSVMELNNEDNGNRKFILVQLPELTDEKSDAYKAGYKKISDITIERNKRVIQRFEKEDKEKDPALFAEGNKPAKPGFKVYRLEKSNFPRVDFTPDPDKSETENIELLKKYIDDKERTFLSSVNENNLFDEVLLKNGFMLNYSLQRAEAFKKNKVFLAKDEFKECLICLDGVIEEDTVKEAVNFKDKMFICLERSLDTTKKWNLQHALGDKLIAF